MGKLFCIMGKSASGKDTFYSRLSSDSSLDLKKVLLYTTRPKRNNEENGKDYFFVDNKLFEEYLNAGKVIESRTYQTVEGPWHYFTADDGQIDLKKSSYIVIGTLESYLKIREYYGRGSVIPLLIDVEDGERLSRALKREREQKAPKYAEMCRRFLADTEDFSEENIRKAEIEKRFDNIDEDDCYEKLVREIRSGIL